MSSQFAPNPRGRVEIRSAMHTERCARCNVAFAADESVTALFPKARSSSGAVRLHAACVEGAQVAAPVAAPALEDGQIRARFSSRCACCGYAVSVGSLLARHVLTQDWVHARCATTQDPTAQCY